MGDGVGEKGEPSPESFRAELGLTDFTLLVIGAVIGDGIYVVGAMGARFLGPAQVVAWLVAGGLAALIALAFVQCSAIDSDVGGSYAYARKAFGPLIGFLAGWSLYLGEWVALSAFPLAFATYFGVLVGPLTSIESLALRFVLIGCVTYLNLIGIRQGARTNDFLTVAKLLPLAVLILLGIVFVVFHGGETRDNLQPFAPLGWGGFGRAILPIFWAYAGFELAVLPAAEVRDARRTLPRGLIIGMTVATIFYLLTSVIVVGALPWQDAAASTRPLALVMAAVLGGLGGPANLGSRLVSAGALVSIAGVYLVFTLTLARLSYALARDGLFPAAFARLHPRYGTPYVGIAFQAGSAAICTSLFDLRGLLTTAVFFLSFTYLLTALSAIRLVSSAPDAALHVPGLRGLFMLAALGSLYLAAQGSLVQIMIGFVLLLAGLVLYALRRPQWQEPRVIQPPAHRERTLLVREHHLHGWLLRSMRRLFG